MTTLIDLMRQPSIAALAWALIHFLWQGALLGAATFVILRALRAHRASTRYLVSVATLAAMMLTFVTTFAILARQPSAPPQLDMPAATFTAVEAVTIALSSPIQTIPSLSRRSLGEGGALLSLIVVAWTIGVFALSIRLLGGWLVTRRLATRAATAVSPAIDAAARAVASRLQIRRAVAILESQAVAVPTLVGWLKPVVLLPAAALTGLSPDQLRAILAHELAHIRRHDYLVNLLQSVVETLLFYHPATWWVSARIRAEREHCCDDLAVEVCGDRLVYASALAELTSMAGSRGFALAATDGSLLDRVRRILGGPRSIHEPAPAWPLLALVVVVAGTGSFTADTNRTETRLAATTGQQFAALPVAVVPARVREVQTVAPSTPDHDQAGAHSDEIAALARKLEEVRKAEKAAELRAELLKLVQARARMAAAIEESQPSTPTAPKPPQDLGSRGSGNISWSNDDEKLTVRWTGAFRLSDDEKDIEWVEDGATVTITDGVSVTSRIELRGTRNGVERQYFRNGSRRDYEPEGRAMLAAALEKLIRHSGAFAKERVAKFLKRGGPDAVLAEIDRLDTSSYIRRVYYTELLQQAPVSEALLGRVLQRVPAELRSDYDKATLLTHAAQLPAMNDTHRVAIARAARSIGSDYDQRRTLVAILNTRPVAPMVAAAVLDATESIGSSHDRSQVLRAVVESGGLTPATAQAFTIRISNMSSHDHSTTLIHLIERGGLTDATADTFFGSAAGIPSSHDLSRVLLKALERQDVSARILEGVLRTVPKVGSSHDRANVLVSIANRGRLSPEARKLYIAASRDLSTHDENRALAALVRNEGR